MEKNISINPIIDIITNGWDEDVEKYDKSAINQLANHHLPSLFKLAKELQITTDTKYSIEELVNFAYIGFVSLIVQHENGILDFGEIKDQTKTFLLKIIEAEEMEIDSLNTYECRNQNCLGKDCKIHKCYATTNEAINPNVKSYEETKAFLEFIRQEQEREKVAKVLTLNNYRKM